MAQYRQSGNGGVVGNGVVVASGHHHHQQLQQSAVSIGIHSGGSLSSQKHQLQQQGRHLHHQRRLKSWHRKISITALTVFLCIALLTSVIAFVFLSSQNKEISSSHSQDDEIGNDADFLTNVTRTSKSKVLKFGHRRDSRYWDRDDRRRVKEYSEEDLEKALEDSVPMTKSHKDSHHRVSGLYNEAGRDELKRYEAEYEASLDNIEKPKYDNLGTDQLMNDAYVKTENKVVDVDDEYDDGIDSQDVQRGDEYTEVGHSDKTDTKSRSVGLFGGQSGKIPALNRRMGSKKKSKRHKFGPCEMKLLNSSALLVEPLESRKFARFSLQYTDTEEKPIDNEQWEPRFAGHQSLDEREESFIARDQKINCGFVKGPKGSPSTGFDLAEDDSKYISSCHIAVASCIFGNSDRLRLPAGKTISKLSKKNVCFVMFVDETTLETLSSEGHMADRMGFIGLWRMVVVKNLPYTDMRRVGKIPKLLSHRLFPSARYSIWLDSKLRMQLDPLLILEYLLWRKGFEYAISNHYDRHCVWEEVAQNKKLNKYNHTVIDEQFAFYQADGLKRFDPSDPNKFLPSNVPEGSLIVRAHTPMSNLFSCLWFNEVDRFTSRDQLSFAYTYHKLRKTNQEKPFRLNMFKDCERRKIAKLFHHRSEEKKSMLQHDSE